MIGRGRNKERTITQLQIKRRVENRHLKRARVFSLNLEGNQSERQKTSEPKSQLED
jgi:hypothetical protein